MKMAKLIRLLWIAPLLILLPFAFGTAPDNLESKLASLLSIMTVEEKFGQLQQLDGLADGSYRPEHLDLIRKGLLSSTLNVRGARRTNELQRIAVEESRLRIPVLFAFDVIHGYRTIFPIPLAEACSWDPKIVERAASIAAAEASAAGVRWTFAPMVDIARDPRWGRIAEGAGEDPYLGSVMARARVHGFQGDDYSVPDKVLACAKHWAAYGAAEGGRDYNTTDVSERRLREIYFPPFKAALDAGVGTFMSAFNDLNGIPTSANPFTLIQVLRSEWKFGGFVVSDYESVKELMRHGVAEDGAKAAQLALNAGVDMEMVSRLYNEYGAKLIRERKVTEARLNEAVRRILRIKFLLGLFEHPYTDEVRESILLSRDHLAAARLVAARSLVLLRNEGDLLPLSKSARSIAVIGPLADSSSIPLGSWIGDGRSEDVVSVLTGIKAAVSPATRILYAKGCEVEGDSTEGIEEAVRIARESEIALLVVGEAAEMSGEAASRSTLDLPGRQLDLVRAVHATGKPTIVVLMNGRPLTINWIAEQVPAILETWFAGTQAGHAIADVLFGDVNPGGKLAVTFPRAVGQIPIYYNHKNTGRPFVPGQKYTSRYLDLPVTPLYPFGYGLSYTRFTLTNLQLSSRTISPDGTITVSVELNNVGNREGDEVVQLYLHDLVASVTRPVKELKGFERVTLGPGEKRRIKFLLTSKHLGFYDREMRFIVEPGTFKVMVGTNSIEGLETTFEVMNM